MFNFLSFLMSLLHSIPFRHAIHFLACITLDLSFNEERKTVCLGDDLYEDQNLQLSGLEYKLESSLDRSVSLTLPPRQTLRLPDCYLGQSQWLRGLRRGSAASGLLVSWVRISLEAWISVCCQCCVLSGRCLYVGLITHREESYRVWRVQWMWS
jgi:hypothetical protein